MGRFRRERGEKWALRLGQRGGPGGLRLVEEREARLQALRRTLDDSIAEGGGRTEDEVTAALDAEAARLAQEGF